MFHSFNKSCYDTYYNQLFTIIYNAIDSPFQDSYNITKMIISMIPKRDPICWVIPNSYKNPIEKACIVYLKQRANRSTNEGINGQHTFYYFQHGDIIKFRHKFYILLHDSITKLDHRLNGKICTPPSISYPEFPIEINKLIHPKLNHAFINSKSLKQILLRNTKWLKHDYCVCNISKHITIIYQLEDIFYGSFHQQLDKNGSFNKTYYSNEWITTKKQQILSIINEKLNHTEVLYVELITHDIDLHDFDLHDPYEENVTNETNNSTLYKVIGSFESVTDSEYTYLSEWFASIH